MEVLSIKTPMKMWMKNNKHDVNAQQSSQGCKGNTAGPHVNKNLKSDMRRD